MFVPHGTYYQVIAALGSEGKVRGIKMWQSDPRRGHLLRPVTDRATLKALASVAREWMASGLAVKFSYWEEVGEGGYMPPPRSNGTFTFVEKIDLDAPTNRKRKRGMTPTSSARRQSAFVGPPPNQVALRK